MIVPKHASDASSDLVAHWPAACNVPALPTIEALAGLSDNKGELHGGLNRESSKVLALPGQ